MPTSSKIHFRPAIALSGLILLTLATQLRAQSLKSISQPVVQSSCNDCHASGDIVLTFDWPISSRKWVRVYDRIANGEMPPPDSETLDPKKRAIFLRRLEKVLKENNLTNQKSSGRVGLRRLTRTEFEYMLHDLLRIDAPIAELLPEENNSSSFDTVANGQGISALHLESYMHAADAAIDAAIQLDPKPDSEPKRWEYKESKLIRDHIDSDSEEHVIVHELEDAVVMFSDAPYLFRIDDFRAPVRGKYTIRAEVFPYQSKRPIVFSLLAGDYNRGRSRYLGRWDLRAKKSRTVEITVTLDRGEYIYPSPDDLMADARDGRNIWGHEADEYEGSGIGVKWLEVEGPLVNDWPPESTTHLLPGVEIKKLEHQRWERTRHIDYELVPSDDPKEQIRMRQFVRQFVA